MVELQSFHGLTATVDHRLSNWDLNVLSGTKQPLVGIVVPNSTGSLAVAFCCL